MSRAKATTSVCTPCSDTVPALVVERDGRVLLLKECPTHGPEEALLASDARLQVGAVVRMLLEHHPKMNTVILQPAFYLGRYDTEKHGDRLTLAEVANEVSRQTNGLFLPEDFGPIPCSHPNCFAFAVAFVRAGKVIPVSRYFPKFETWSEPSVAKTIAKLADKMPQHRLDALAEDELLDGLLDLLAESDDAANWSDYRNFVLIGIKPFMDACPYDQDRVDRCCVHVIDRSGAPVSLSPSGCSA